MVCFEMLHIDHLIIVRNRLTFNLAPNKNCSRQHFNCLLLSFEENKA